MRTIDADAHVVETERTWDYLDGSDKKYRPLLVPSPEDPKTKWWVIDGKIRGFRLPTLTEMELEERSKRANRHMEFPLAAQGMDDVQLRLRHLDELGIDIQVLHNSLFIEPVTNETSTEIALCGSWNRWLADIYQQAGGRLNWSCVPSTKSIPHALEQIRFAKQHGAVAVLMRVIEGDRLMFDPYFYPIYEEASRLDMAIAIHIAVGNDFLSDLMSTPYDSGAGTVMKFRMWDVGACIGLLVGHLRERFPDLRWGFIETAAQWVPWVHLETVRRAEAAGRELPKDFWGEYKIYVTCQSDDDIPYITRYCGDRVLVLGTDYGHTDHSAEVDVFRSFQERSDLDDHTKERILSENARMLYGL